MALKNTRIIYTAKNFTTGLADVTADIRRDGVSVATGVALSDIGNGRYELLLTPALITSYGGAGFFDFLINSASKNLPAVAGKWILENDEDDLQSQIASIDTKIDTIDSNLDAAILDISSIKTTVEDTNTEVNDGSHGLANLKTLIDAIQSSVTNISNVTRFSAPIPKPLVRPETGTKTYKIPVTMYDNNGNMEDPDSNQIQLSIADESGNSRDSLIVGFAAQPHYITRNAQGDYEFEIQLDNTTALEQLNFKFNYLEATVPLVQYATTEVTLDVAASGLALETTAQSILADTAAMQPQVADIQTKVNDATYGLAALKTLLDTIAGYTDSVEGELANATYGLAALRTQMDLKASQSSVNTLQSDVTAVKGTGFNGTEDSLAAISDRVFSGGYAV